MKKLTFENSEIKKETKEEKEIKDKEFKEKYNIELNRRDFKW